MMYLDIINPTALQSELDIVLENIRSAREEDRYGYLSWRSAHIMKSIEPMSQDQRDRRREAMLEYHRRKREIEKHPIQAVYTQ